MNLEKILQSQGFGSRKHCQQLIKQGAVAIDGVIVADAKQGLDISDLSFSVFGQEYQYREQVYIALHKPQGYECSHQATHHLSVFDLFDQILLQRGLQCVGRLDQDTTGLLLFTDDGQLLQALTHPKKHVPKVYHVHCVDPITDQQLQDLTDGVELRNEPGVFAATDVVQLSEYSLKMTIHQGVYHQVKRMLAAVGNKVDRLHRAQMGALQLTQLALGQWQYLNDEQVSRLRDPQAILQI